ncbi:hypothetical protein [Zhongshania sp. BJYM1]|uniref:hypothetical protein n=1 Tax=Zhongshania aquatica TaxID=2965069 RepID=UPI0022B2C9AC|nr:hypothetical protein [Marortus sp. BJYM1]
MVRVVFLSLIVFIIAACGGKESSIDEDALSVAAGEEGAAPCPIANESSARGMPSESRIFGWIEDLVGIGFRRTGTPAGYAAAAYVKCQFESLGLENVHYIKAISWKWEATNSSVEIGGEPVDTFPSVFLSVTPDEGFVFSTDRRVLAAQLIDIATAFIDAIDVTPSDQIGLPLAALDSEFGLQVML